MEKINVFQMDGHSMDNGNIRDSIADGEFIMTLEVDRPLEDKYYVIVAKDECFVKKLIKVNSEVFTCNSVNPNKAEYPDFNLNVNECRFFEIKSVQKKTAHVMYDHDYEEAPVPEMTEGIIN